MNRLHKHIPNFVDDRGADRTPFEFETLEDLKNLEWVKHYMGVAGKRFEHLCVSENRLMAVYDHGFHWWVIGYLEHPVEGLPQWEGWKHRALGADGQVRVVGREAVSSCGDVLTMEDGSLMLNVTDGVPPNALERVRNLKQPKPVWVPFKPERVVFPLFGTAGW